jgi:hypothetical protein
MRSYLSLKNLGLLLINFIPLFGVFIWAWDAMGIITFYVIETIMVGLIHLIKMTILYAMNHNNPQALAIERHNSGVSGLGLIPFFMVHFGFFIFVQIMVFNGFTNQSFWQSLPIWWSGPYKYALAALFLTKFTWLMADIIWNPAIKTKLPDDVFFEPYPRIFIQQFMVILGGWATLFGKGLWGYLLILILCKTTLDLLIANLSKDRLSVLLKKYEKK